MTTATGITTTEDFSKVLNPGLIEVSYGRNVRVFVKIEYTGGRLSLTGVEGPRASGNCAGSCGQITDSLDNIEPGNGWTVGLIAQLKETWDAWHLNDMQSGCEHQRAEGWGKEEVEVVTYGLTQEAHKLRKEALGEASCAAQAGKVANLTDTGKMLIDPDWFQDRFSPPDADSPLSGCYEVRKRETKHSNWVKENEHPKGVLSKACPTCGYKHGSAWLREDVPIDVLDFLKSLPNSEVTPAWV